jgi:hypothetical protein
MLLLCCGNASNVVHEPYSALSFEYTATSRNYYQHLKVNATTLMQTQKQGAKFSKQELQPQQWRDIIKISKTIDFESIPKLIAPSKDFLFDGAPIARLIINSNGETYTSAAFDHGNPPKDIASLIKALLSLGENIE